MQVLVSSEDPFCCDEELIRRIEGVLEGKLERFSAGISRIDVRLSDLNTVNTGDRDKSCELEARLVGGDSVKASHEAATMTEAIHAAADKLRRAIAHGSKAQVGVPAGSAA